MLKIDQKLFEENQIKLLGSNIIRYIQNINNNNIKYNVIYAPEPIYTYLMLVSSISFNKGKMICTIFDHYNNKYELKYNNNFILSYNKKRFREVKINSLLNNQTNQPLMIKYVMVKKDDQ